MQHYNDDHGVVDFGDGSFITKRGEAPSTCSVFTATVALKGCLAAIVLSATGMATTHGAQAQYRPQYRMPSPNFRPGPQMIMPAINGASRLGWQAGSMWSQRQYGPSANPGPWPGLGPALGFRRR